MANNIAWQPMSFTPVKFDPSAGFASAAKTFQGIDKTLQEREEAESLAAYRAAETAMGERKQTYTEGAAVRAIEEEERQKGIESGKLKLFQEISDEAGERGKARFADEGIQSLLAQDPNFSKRPEEEQKALLSEYLSTATGARAGADPSVYGPAVRRAMVESGEFSGKRIESDMKASIGRLFPTLSQEGQKDLFTAIKPLATGGGTGTGGAGGAGTFKPWSSMPSAMDENTIHKNFMEMYPIDKAENMRLLGMEFDYTGPGGAVDVTGPDVRKLSTTMKQEGINPAATYAVLEKYIQGNNLDFDPADMTDAQKTSFKAEAKLVMDQQAQGYNSKTGALSGRGAQQRGIQSDYYKQIDKIRALGASKKLSNEELVKVFLSDIGDYTPPTVPVQGSNVVPQPAPQTPAPTGNIMPTAAPAPTPVPAAMPAQTGGIMPGADTQQQQQIAVDQVIGRVQGALKMGRHPTPQEANFLLNFPGAMEQLTPQQLRAVKAAVQ